MNRRPRVLWMWALGGMLACAPSALLAQPGEIERDLWAVPVVAPNRLPSEAHRGGALSLPFFDDFSTPSLPGAGVEFEPFRRWDDASARITTTFSLDAPTIGVATLDGLRSDGYPYSFDASTGWADTLTSRTINLNGYTAESNIHLVFHLQAGGRGNAPEPGEDRIVLEFRGVDGVTGEEFWTEVWATDTAPTTSFERHFVPVDQQIHLFGGFQFRFRNDGALGGNADLWHLDYVLLDDAIDPETFSVFSEIAFTEPVNTLLREFTRMPWTHYLTSPELFMRDSVTTYHRNFSATQTDNVTGGFTVRYDADAAGTTYPNGFSQTNIPPATTFTTGYFVGDGPAGPVFAFDPTVNDTCARFDVGFYASSIGLLHTEKVGVPDNDSIVFTQEFLNDYAYDDGSAEKAWSLTAAGGRAAYRFALATPDTLLGLAIHFTPYYTNADAANFLLRAWSDAGGLPGEELGENYLFHTPQYFTDGYDLFQFYTYDDPIPVEGTIHVGWVQESASMLNVGLDKNTNANLGRLHYSLGLGGAWLPSTIEGSLMVRPVLRAGKQDTWTAVDQLPGEDQGLRAFPNPTAGGGCTVEGVAPGAWVLVDGMGRQVRTGTVNGGGRVEVGSGLAPGVYSFRDAAGRGVRIVVGQ